MNSVYNSKRRVSPITLYLTMTKYYKLSTLLRNVMPRSPVSKWQRNNVWSLHQSQYNVGRFGQARQSLTQQNWRIFKLHKTAVLLPTQFHLTDNSDDLRKFVGVMTTSGYRKEKRPCMRGPLTHTTTLPSPHTTKQEHQLYIGRPRVQIPKCSALHL